MYSYLHISDEFYLWLLNFINLKRAQNQNRNAKFLWSLKFKKKRNKTFTPLILFSFFLTLQDGLGGRMCGTLLGNLGSHQDDRRTDLIHAFLSFERRCRAKSVVHTRKRETGRKMRKVTQRAKNESGLLSLPSNLYMNPYICIFYVSLYMYPFIYVSL